MRLVFKVEYDDGREVKAVAKPVDIMEYERRYHTSFMQFSNASPMEHIFFLAWAPLHRTGTDPRDFEAFMADIAVIEEVDEKPPVPTKRGRSGASSPASP